MDKKTWQKIHRVKYEFSPQFAREVQKYLRKSINLIKTHRRFFGISEVKAGIPELHKLAGVYFFYLEFEGKIIFTYVGESNDILKRWRQHIASFTAAPESMYKKIRSRTKNIPDWNKYVAFAVLEEEPDLNRRLYRETYNIFRYKARYISINNKNCSRQLRCRNGHGMCKAWLTYDPDPTCMQPIIKGKCKNSSCKEYFLIS